MNNEPSARSVARRSRYIEEERQILTAAKDLLSSTLVPVKAYEETIVLACQKVSSDANKVGPAPTDEYSDIQKSLTEYKRISEEFKKVVDQVQDYRNQLNTNRYNVSHMGNTLNETQREVTTKLQMKRTANVETRDKMGLLEAHINDLHSEYDAVTSELNELEARVAVLRERKAKLEDDIETSEDERTNLVLSEKNESKNETEIAERQESLQATRALIDNGDSELTQLHNSTNERLLKAGLNYADFLRKYNNYVHDLIDQFDYKIRTMESRIEAETRNYDEVAKLHLKMDSSKLTALIAEYKSNLARFHRRKDKIVAIENVIRHDFVDVQALVGEFGRELEPM